MSEDGVNTEVTANRVDWKNKTCCADPASSGIRMVR